MFESHAFRYIEDQDQANVNLTQAMCMHATRNLDIKGTTVVTADMLEYLNNNHMKT